MVRGFYCFIYQCFIAIRLRGGISATEAITAVNLRPYMRPTVFNPKTGRILLLGRNSNRFLVWNAGSTTVLTDFERFLVRNAGSTTVLTDFDQFPVRHL